MTTYWYLYLIFIPLGIVAVTYQPLWRFIWFIDTVFHEFGHGLVSILVGNKLHGFKLRFNEPGLTLSFTTGPGLRSTASTLAGYPAPIIIGGLSLYYTWYGYSYVFAWIFVGVSLFMAIFIRNLFGFVPLILVGGLGGLSLWLEQYSSISTILFAILMGTLLVFSGVNSIFRMAKSLPEGSDAWALYSQTGIPQRFWFGLMFLLAVAFIFIYIWLIGWIVNIVSSYI